METYLFNTKGHEIKVKFGVSQINRLRTDNLFKAKAAVEKKFPTGKVDIDFEHREIKLNGAAVFTQSKEQLSGTFSGVCGDLSLA